MEAIGAASQGRVMMRRYGFSGLKIMEWSNYTFAEAVDNITERVRTNENLSLEDRCRQLSQLLRTMIQKLPPEWKSDTQLRGTGADTYTVLQLLDRDLRKINYQPAQYAVFGSLRRLAAVMLEIRKTIEANAQPFFNPRPGNSDSGYSGFVG